MDESVQYTIQNNQAVSLSIVARFKNISRKLLFNLMEEQGLIKVDSKSKRLTSEKYGFTTQHITRTAIYIYTHKIDKLFKELNIPNIAEHQRMCYDCRKVKGVKAFRERMAVCSECKYSLKECKKSTKSLKISKDGINPYFLRRGLKND